MAVGDGTAIVAIDGAIRVVPLIVLGASGMAVSPGDFLLVHTGLAVAVLTPQEAAERTAFLRQGAAREDP